MQHGTKKFGEDGDSPEKRGSQPATWLRFFASHGEDMDDRALVAGVRAGDRHALEILIRQHERLVMHMVGRVVSHPSEREELCQDVFLKVYQRLGEFAFQSKLSTWIATIAYRLAINHVRRRMPQTQEILPEAPLSDGADQADDVLHDQQMHAMILQLANRLPPLQKMALHLYHFEQLSYHEISDVMALPEGTVKSYLYRARQHLKDALLKCIPLEDLL